VWTAWKAVLYAGLGENAEARRLFTLCAQMRGSKPRVASEVEARLLAARLRDGERGLAVEELIRSVQQNVAGFRGTTQFDPIFDSLRDEPWFKTAIETGERDGSEKGRALSPADEKSVAVLAFADNSPGHDSEYFSDGISEELINALGKVPGLKVPAGTSSFYFKGKKVPMPEIAKQLGVAYVIEGSVQRAGDKVKISARLSKAADGFQVWTDSFLRDAKDVFAVEEEIAGLIAQRLSLKLGVSSAAATASVNPEAFELYVQAQQLWNMRTTDGLNRAENLLNRALALEPDFARAHAALGEVWNLRGLNGDGMGAFGDRNSPELARIREKAREALALDSNSAETHALLGSLLLSGWQIDEAVRELRLAIVLNPTYATAHQRLSRALFNAGRADEGLAELKLAAELDPLSSRILDNYAGALRRTGRYTESLAVAERAVAVQPDNVQALLAKSRTLLALGRAEEAAAVIRGLAADSDFAITAMAIVLAGVGRPAEAETELSRSKNVSYRWFVLAALGRRTESAAAFDAQRLTVNQLTDFLFDPNCDLVRDDPRIVQGIAALGLTEAHARAQAWRKAHPPEKPASK
jgi:TolB-like protein/Flp pilus assembly protein TadD